MIFNNYLKKLNYETIEYSDIILMLYKVLKSKDIEIPDELKFSKDEKE